MFIVGHVCKLVVVDEKDRIRVDGVQLDDEGAWVECRAR